MNTDKRKRINIIRVHLCASVVKVSFQDGTQGTFNGTLEKVDDLWRIDGIYVQVPPSKFK